MVYLPPIIDLVPHHQRQLKTAKGQIPLRSREQPRQTHVYYRQYFLNWLRLDCTQKGFNE